MAREFGVNRCEPIEGAYTDVEAPINEAYLDLRDALEVYGELFGRRTASSTTAGIRDGEPVIQEMTLESETRERYSNTVLEGTVEAQEDAQGTTIEYAFTFKPRSKMQDALAEYVFVTELLDPGTEQREPADLLHDAGIVLDEADIRTMLQDRAVEDAEGRAARCLEAHAGVGGGRDWLEPGDMVAAEVYADWMGNHFNPGQHQISPEEHRIRNADASDTAADGDSPEWAFRAILRDRSREKNAVTYTVELQAYDSGKPFTADINEAGTITFTVPYEEETLRETRKLLHDSM